MDYQEREVEIYEVLRSSLETMARDAGVKDLEAYFTPLRLNETLSNWEDFKTFGKRSSIAELADQKDVMMQQFAFSLQNSGWMSRAIGLTLPTESSKSAEGGEITRDEKMKELLCGFEPQGIWKEYGAEDGTKKLSMAILDSYKPNNQANANEYSSKSLLSRYAQGIIDAARFLENQVGDLKQTGAELIGEAILLSESETWTEEMETIPKIVRRVHGLGGSGALACDFLKECGCKWLSKPDTHIVKVFPSIVDMTSKLSDGELDERKREKEIAKRLPKELFEYTRRVREGKGDDTITAYKVDKIIWLLCTGDFYLDGIKGHRDILIHKLSRS